MSRRRKCFLLLGKQQKIRIKKETQTNGNKTTRNHINGKTIKFSRKQTNNETY